MSDENTVVYSFDKCNDKKSYKEFKYMPNKIEKLLQICLVTTNILNKRVIPNVKDPQDHYEDTLNNYIKENISWLDYGCGKKILVPWHQDKEVDLVSRCARVVGVDPVYEEGFQHSTIKELYKIEGYQLPFADNTFDLVSANMVVEHLEDPCASFTEIKRVLKPGGAFIFHTPNIYGHIALISSLLPETINKILAYLLTGRKSEDVFKTYYKANSQSQVINLAKESGFKVEEIKFVEEAPLGMGILFPPIYFAELAWVKLTTLETFKTLRGNLIVILRK